MFFLSFSVLRSVAPNASLSHCFVAPDVNIRETSFRKKNTNTKQQNRNGNNGEYYKKVR